MKNALQILYFQDVWGVGQTLKKIRDAVWFYRNYLFGNWNYRLEILWGLTRA